MYVTRPLSLFRRSPELLSSPPPEGPNSGILVLQDEESVPNCCFGLSKLCCVVDLPFPQNKLLSVHYQAGQVAFCNDVYMIPILSQPLSSNRYYAIKPHGSHQGEAFTCSKDEDMGKCLFCFNYAKNEKPRPLDTEDVYQQMEIVEHGLCTPNDPIFLWSTHFTARSVASDGHPPCFLRRCGWTMFSRKAKNFTLGEASGIDTALRSRLPDLITSPLSPVTVGKWYCPFMFVKDGEIKNQLKKTMFYEMTLQQRWEQIFTCENRYGAGKRSVEIDVTVPNQVARVGGEVAVQEERGGFVWLAEEIGLSSLILERLVWEEERVGWVRKEKQERVVRSEKFGGAGEWARFGCYMLVETFVLKRMDGSVVLSYDFNHIHQIRTKWE